MVTITTPPADTPPAPPQHWFAKLDPAWRALLVLLLSTAISIGWQKLLPGTTPPPLPLPQEQPQTPAVLVLNVGQPATVTAAK